MSNLRYYPSFFVQSNLFADPSDLGGNLYLNGKPYSGKYYSTLNGRFFTGENPFVGTNEELFLYDDYNKNIPGLEGSFLPSETIRALRQQIKTAPGLGKAQGFPVSYYPNPNESDYRKGYIMRFFTKKENESKITEISEQEYESIVDGSAKYDISIYLVTKILWKLTGPLNSQRKSQYNIIPGIIDTNQRLTEEANKTFLGIVEFIGGKYDKFARPTA